MNITNEYNYQLSVQQVLAKNIINLPKAKKKSAKFVCVLPNQCRSHFNLTNFLTTKFRI